MNAQTTPVMVGADAQSSLESFITNSPLQSYFALKNRNAVRSIAGDKVAVVNFVFPIEAVGHE